MKPRPLALLVVASLLLSLATLAGACGDDGEEELTLEQYFDRIDAVQNAADASFENIERRHPDLTEDADAAEAAVADAADIAQGVRDEMLDIDAPTEVADAHQELIDALGGLLDLQAAAQQLLLDVETPEQLQELADAFATDATYTAADKRLDEACQALQDIADQNNIEVDLGCGED